jgi:hypothetical protein
LEKEGERERDLLFVEELSLLKMCVDDCSGRWVKKNIINYWVVKCIPRWSTDA